MTHPHNVFGVKTQERGRGRNRERERKKERETEREKERKRERVLGTRAHSRLCATSE